MTWVQDDGAGGIGAALSVTDEELNAYIDGELTSGRRRVIERLIARGETVRTRLDELLRVRRLVRMAYLFPARSDS